MGTTSRGAALACAAAVLLAGCSAAAEPEPAGGVRAAAEQVVDVGEGRTVRIAAGDRLDVGLFIATTGNVYSRRLADEAEAFAAARGFELTVHDARYDGNTQFNQLTSALQRGDHNAWYVTPINGMQTCALLSEQAPAAGILVTISDIALCGRDGRPADDVWQPGTLNYVGAESTTTYLDAWLAAVADRLQGPHRVGVLLGPPLITLSRNVEAGLERLRQRRPDLEVVAVANTDFTTPDGLARTQTMLQAEPDLDVIVSVYADITVGAAQAVRQAGRPGIQIFDLGGAESELPFIADGTITASAAYSPRGHARAALEAVLAAFAGQPVERYASGLTHGETGAPHLVDRTNVAGYRPEF